MKSMNRLRVVRAEKRITQEALEAKLKKFKISQTRISLIENGDEATDSEKKAIARALRLSVQEVFPLDEAVAS